MKSLELAGYGMDFVGVAAGGWYAAARYQDRARRDADRNLAFGETSVTPGLLSEPGLSLGCLSADATGDDDVETGAEELLAARMGRFDEPFIGVLVGWCEWIWRRLVFLRWLRLPLLVPVGLVLFAPLMALCALLLPFVIVGFLLDADNDFRLRIIVLAFTLGICLQVTNALTG